MVRVMGQRFELNDPFVSVIGELELRHERGSEPSMMRQIESAQKKGNPLSVILEENSDMLGEFQISNRAADAAAASASAAVAAAEEPEESEDEGGNVEEEAEEKVEEEAEEEAEEKAEEEAKGEE